MSTDHDLDTRIRALVADAVSVAPPAPELQHGVTVTALPPRRTTSWVIAGLTAAAAAVGLVAVLVTREPDRRITPATTVAPVTTVAPATSVAPGTTVSTTTEPGTTLAPPTTVPAPDFAGEVLTAGPDGVWLVGDFDPAQLTTEPMTFAVRAPDGSVIMQRRSGYGSDWTQGDTIPLVWRGAGGPIEELLPGADWADDVWIRLHDVAMVNGQMVLLYQVEHTPVPQEPGGSLVAYTFDTGETTIVADDVGGWEQGVSRLHLAANGLIIGEQSSEVTTSLAVFGLPGAPSLTAAELGLEASYSDCSTCPHAYTVSRDGGTIAWLEQRELVRWDLTDGAERDRTDLGTDDVLSAVDLDLDVNPDGKHVVISRWLPEGPPAPLLISRAASGVVELSGTSATMSQPVDPSFDPWTDQPEIAAAHAGIAYATIDEVRAAVEHTILLGYAVDDQSQVTFRTGDSNDPSVLVILAPTFDDSVVSTHYEVTVIGDAGSLSVQRVRAAGACRGGGFSSPARLCP